VSLSELSLFVLGGYLLALVAVALVARRARADASPADHFLAGRQLGVFVLFLTLYATAYSGNSLLGYPGEAYQRGFSWIMATGFMIAIIVCFHILAPKLRPLARRRGFVTPGDWMRHRFGGEQGGAALRICVAALMSWALGNFLLAQMQAMGELTEIVTGGAVPYLAGVLGLAAVILFYEHMGGMRAVAWTDAAQGTLMVVGLASLLGWLLSEVGGLGELTRAVAEARPGALRVPDSVERANWASSIVLLGLASVVYPQAIQRIYAARSGQTLKRSLAIMTFMPLTTTLVVTLIGLAAIPRFEGLGQLEKDGVMPLLLGQWADSGPIAMSLAALVFLGALAAIMSTADSVLLSLGSVLAVDLLGRPSSAPATTRLGKRIAMLVMALVVALAWNPKLDLWRLIELKMELLIQCVPAFLLAIHWRGLSARAVLAGILAGSAVAVVPSLLGVTRIGGVHIGVIGLAANLAVLGITAALQRGRRAANG